MDIPLSKSDYSRGVAKEARISTRNRYFEQNPVLNENNFAMISRPALRRWLYVGQRSDPRRLFAARHVR
jgi:hypothetical protein